MNQIRIDEFKRAIAEQDLNLEKSLELVSELKAFISDSTHILGSEITKHGEVAEHIQVEISNARQLINGLPQNHTFDNVNRIAREDYLRNGLPVQSKFYNGLKNTMLHGVKGHLNKYPDFVKAKGVYDIPKDQYESLVDLTNKYKKSPSLLSKSEFNTIKKIDEFISENHLEIGKDIKPSIVDYDAVQNNVADKTVHKEELGIKKIDSKIRSDAYEDSLPSAGECALVTGVSAALEGGVSCGIAISKKLKEKKFFEFTLEDWKSIGGETGKGVVKGGIRGSSVYVLTNSTGIHSSIACGYVTAVFGVISQMKSYNDGNISEEDFVINCETLCVDVAVSTISSFAGSVLIPIPVVGAVVGNIAGNYVYSICKKYGNKKEQEIIAKHNKHIAEFDAKLDREYRKIIDEIYAKLNSFLAIEDLAFDENVNVAFCSSIELADHLNIESSKVLRTIDQVDEYFLS